MNRMTATTALLCLLPLVTRADDKPPTYTKEAAQEVKADYDKNPTNAAKKYNGTQWIIDGRVTLFTTGTGMMIAMEFESFPIGLVDGKEMEKVEKGTAYRFTCTMRADKGGMRVFNKATVGETLKDFKSHVDRKAEDQKKNKKS